MSNDNIVNKLIEHDEKLDKVVTQDEFNGFREKSLQNQGEALVILKRLDEERVFTLEMVKRIEGEVKEQKKQVEEHDKQLQKIKLELKIA
ncbi:MAG: hypothetical protein HQ538_05490 [Parcubacteria group bacterium]|nr:hypothetical protein [Parcubacteria group bacterium]